MSKNSLADLLRNDPWGKPSTSPTTNAATTWEDAARGGFGFRGAVDTYLNRLSRYQAEAQGLLDASQDPNAEGLQRVAYLTGGLGLKVANPLLAIMPTAQELRDRGYQAGASPEMQAVGGALGDMVNIPEPASVGTLLAGLGKAAVGAKGLAGAAAMAGKSAAVAPLGKGLGSLLADATPAEQAALKARLEAEAAQTGGQASSVSREQALNGLTGGGNVGGMSEDAPIIAYHGSPKTFEDFNPRMSKHRGVTFFSTNEQTAKKFTSGSETGSVGKFQINGKLFDPTNPEHKSMLNDAIDKNFRSWFSGALFGPESAKSSAAVGDWGVFERPDVMKFLKSKGFDGWRFNESIKEGPTDSIALFNTKRATRIK